MDNIPRKDYVELELLNQRLTELQQAISIGMQQLEHSSIAIDTLSSLESASKNQELLIPVGSGVFITVKTDDVKNVKLAVGAGVVVDKPLTETIKFLSLQRIEIEKYSSQTERLYEQTISKINLLQQKIESNIKSNN